MATMRALLGLDATKHRFGVARTKGGAQYEPLTTLSLGHCGPG